jgi:hypothetical protein
MLLRKRESAKMERSTEGMLADHESRIAKLEKKVFGDKKKSAKEADEESAPEKGD